MRHTKAVKLDLSSALVWTLMDDWLKHRKISARGCASTVQWRKKGNSGALERRPLKRCANSSVYAHITKKQTTWNDYLARVAEIEWKEDSETVLCFTSIISCDPGLHACWKRRCLPSTNSLRALGSSWSKLNIQTDTDTTCLASKFKKTTAQYIRTLQIAIGHSFSACWEGGMVKKATNQNAYRSKVNV